MRDCRLIDATPIRLKQWIADNVLLQLKTAPWDLGDAGLVPEAGSCTNCPKRTGANAALFGDLTAVEDTCTDPACFANKRVEFVQFVQNKAKVEGKPLLKLTSKTGYKPLGELDSIDLAKKKLTDGQWMQVKKGECADTRLGLMLDGDDMGKTLYVCANQKCKVHKHHVEGERAASVKSDIPAVENWKQRQDRERREYEEKARTENPARLAIYLAVREKATCGDEAALQVFLRSAVTEIIEGDVMGGVSRETVLRLGGDVKVKDDFQAQRTAVAKAIKAAQGVRLYAMLFDCIFGNLTEVNEYSDDEYKKQLFALAKAYGVDAAGIEKRTRVAQNVHPTAAQEAAALDKIDKAIKGLPGKKAKKRLSPEARKSIAANLRKKWAENKKGKV